MIDVRPTLTLRDVAQLAGVQRAVVSMWRRRPRVRGHSIPFPDAIPGSGPVERFARADIVEWLTRTGRGKNAEHRLDAPTLSVPTGASLEDLVILLCLYAHGDSDLAEMTPGERESLARRSDPQDEFLLTEVRQLEVTDEVLRFVDDLVEASFGLPEALARLENGSAGRALGRRELTTEALALVDAIVKTCILHLDPDGVPVVFAGDPPSLGLAVASSARGLVIQGVRPTDRALRRRAVLQELDVADSAEGPLLRVLSVLGLDSDSALNQVDLLSLDLGADEVAVVLGPAGPLCERLRGDAERSRATTLRMERLVVGLRLPRGMWREAHRQALGMWICTGGQKTARPMVADLGAFPAHLLSVQDIASDVSATLSRDGRRAFRYLRVADLPAILTGAPIVPPGARAPHLRALPDNHLDRVQAAAMVVAEPQPPLNVLVTTAPGTTLLRQRSLGELHEKGLVAVQRGRRIDPRHAVPDGSVPVLSGDGTTDGVALDPFDAERLYPRAKRTEPGDVVFVEGKTPRAVVDERGGSLVASPSRILRLHRNFGVGPHTVAAIINNQSVTSEWQRWSIPLLDPHTAEALEAALTEAATYSVALRRRQDALHDLINALIDGVAAGAVTVVSREKTQEGQVAHATT